MPAGTHIPRYDEGLVHQSQSSRSRIFCRTIHRKSIPRQRTEFNYTDIGFANRISNSSILQSPLPFFSLDDERERYTKFIFRFTTN